MVVLSAFFAAVPSQAQVHTVLFSVSDAGMSRAITNWGYDTAWNNSDNIQRSLIFMGTNVANCVRVSPATSSVLTNGSSIWNSSLSAADQLYLANMVSEIRGYTPNAKWYFACGDVNTNWYSSATYRLYPDRFAAMWGANVRYLKTLANPPSITWIDMANEPDYSGNTAEGSAADYYNTLGYLQTNSDFTGKIMGGCATLNSDQALTWFNPLLPLATLGSTHNLAGSEAGYVNFIQTVAADNAISFEPEVHNVGECIIGANYGLNGVIWWGAAELARGQFAQACQGSRLGYSEDQTRWTAAAVYRAPGGNVQGFAGASERTALTTTYQFFSKDRDVFYDGNGPRRDYNVTLTGSPTYGAGDDNERVVNITWGADVPPAIGGRYLIVNRNSEKVLEVPGASTNNGVQLDQNTYTNGPNQQWDVSLIPGNSIGDLSYYTVTAAHDGVTMDLNGYSYALGAAIQQWNGGTNTVEQWYFQYTSNGWFKIKSRWSGKLIGVNGASTANGAVAVQWNDTGTLDQQWRLIPATVSTYDFVAPAAPTQVTATANAVSVQLNWKTNSESDLASYTVLRSTTNGGPYDIVARGLTVNSFTDKSANLARNYYYIVKAVDRSLNTSAGSSQVVAQPTGSPALIANYTFDGNLNDSSGNANNPIVTNGSPTLVAGKYGSALGLSGTNQSLMLPAGMLAAATSFTIATWVYWNGGAAWQRIFDFGNDTTQYMFLTPASGSGTLRFAVTTNGGGGEQIVETSPLPTGQWVHVAVTYDGSVASLYTNGVLAASGAVTIPPASFNPALNFLGQSQYSGDPYFSGALDNFEVANYAMSAAQVAWLPISSAPLPVLAHRYTFNEPGGSTTVTDSVAGPVWNGTLPNGGTFASGKLSFAAASQQYLNLPGGILSNYTAVTIDMWVPGISGATASPPFVYLFSFGNTDGGGNGGNYIFFNPNNSRTVISAGDPGYYNNAEQGGNLPSSLGLATNLHLTCVFNPPSGLISVYTNGMLAATFTGVTDPLSVVGNQYAYIGRSLYTGDAYLTWSIQELRIYNGAMSAADVAGSQTAGPNVLLTTNVALNTSKSGNGSTLNWPVAGTGFTLACSPTLGSGAVWTSVVAVPSVVGGNYQFSIAPTNGTLFFRLQR